MQQTVLLLIISRFMHLLHLLPKYIPPAGKKKFLKMKYADQVYEYLMNLRPGDRINVRAAKDPEKFIECVKDLMDNWGLRTVVEFNADYTVLRRLTNENQ